MLVSSIFLKLGVYMERILVLRSLLLYVYTEYSCTHITTGFRYKSSMDWEGYYGSVAFMWMNYTRLIRTISSTKTNHSDKCNKWFIPQ